MCGEKRLGACRQVDGVVPVREAEQGQAVCAEIGAGEGQRAFNVIKHGRCLEADSPACPFHRMGSSHPEMQHRLFP